jgi:hypothetical protein
MAPSPSTKTWHSEGGKLFLCEYILASFNSYLACAQCCPDLAAQAPLPYQPHMAFVKNQGGNAPNNTVRRQWSCRIANSKGAKLSCRKLSVTEMLALCWAQLTPAQLDESVREITATHDITSLENTDLRAWLAKHDQRDPQPGIEPSTPTSSASATTKRKATDRTGETPSRASRHVRNTQLAARASDSSPPPPSRFPIRPHPTVPLIQEALRLEGEMGTSMRQLGQRQQELAALLRTIAAHHPSPAPLLSNPADWIPPTYPSTPSSTSPTHLMSSVSRIPRSVSSTRSTSPARPSGPTRTPPVITYDKMTFLPPGKAKNRQPVELSWMYADCLLQDPGAMTEKEIHDAILQEAARIYTPDQVARIIWCRQLLDDDQTVELAVHSDAVHDLTETWRQKFGLGWSRLDLNEGRREIHSPLYWTGSKLQGPLAIQERDVCSLARAWVLCPSKLVRTYLFSRCKAWHQEKLFYQEVGLYRELQHGTKLPDLA